MKETRLNSRKMRIRVDSHQAQATVLIGFFVTGMILFLVGLNRMSAWYHFVFVLPLIVVTGGYLYKYWEEKGREINDNHNTHQQRK